MDRTHVDPARAGGQSHSDPPPLPRTVGPFRILRRLGEGGMGSVYLAYDDKNHRPVAIKVLADALANDEDYVRRFKREAQNSTFLNHPSIVRGYGVDQDPGTKSHYLVLEYVDGISAHALLDKVGKLPVGDTVHIILDVARALEHAHSRNVIHRDIKPDNILLTLTGVAKLADLGLAKRTDDELSVTKHKQAFGTPYYMPFEQACDSRKADHRSDLFALGATFYHLLTGTVPFTGQNPLQITEKKQIGLFTPASAHNPTVPRVLDAILAKMMARHPADRYQTASELIVDLERSQLADGVPTFADPEQALLDPYVRERMASSAQATQADLTPPPAAAAKPPERPWHVRFRDAEGKLRQVQMSARGLQQRLKQGRLPADAEISQHAVRDFRPVSEVEPFASLLPAPEPEELNETPQPESTRAYQPLPVATGRFWLFSFLTASLLLLLGCTVAYLVWLRS